MRSIGLIVVLVASCLPAFAQSGAASLGRGDVGVAITNESATGIVNPAALPRINDWDPVCPSETKDGAYWEGTAAYTQDTEGYANEWGVNLAARKLNDNFGIGLAFADFGGGDKSWAFSYGKKLACCGGAWSWGANVRVPHSTTGLDRTTVDLGVLYVKPTTMFGGGNWSFGAVGYDIFDEWGDFEGGGTTIDAGLGLTLKRFRLAADVWDITNNSEVAGSDDSGTQFAIGAEYKVCKMLTVRTGWEQDGWTWGGSIRYRKLVADYGRIEYDNDEDVTKFGEMSLRYIDQW